MPTDDLHNLQRFVDEQQYDYQHALDELRRGRKDSHWIWYIFPQVAGLGSSPMAEEFAIRSGTEAVAYLEHPVLGARLRECAEALLAHEGKAIEDIMEFPDDLKLKSSMTLFASIVKPESVFHRVLDAFYAGRMDSNTIEFLESHS